jgi:Fic family protein
MYSSPHQLEPLLPSAQRQAPLLEKAHALVRCAGQLAISPPSELRTLLRSMNSYYTNRIEGQHTRPLEIEQALRADFSSNPDLAARQRLALAHMEAELFIEQQCDQHAPDASWLYAENAVPMLHQELFGRLPASDLFTPEGEAIIAGQLRQRDVQVGQHVAPQHGSLGDFIARWGQCYRNVRRGEAQLLAAAAAHHRLGWIHPFVDGNGRVMRLHTHAVLTALGYTRGLWSPLRGFAKSTDRYYTLLSEADSPRRGDLDGRGNLSEHNLVNWIDYVLDICIDQVQFMTDMLALPGMESRIHACLLFEEQSQRSGIRREMLRPLHYLYLKQGELERGEFKVMTGLGERTAGTALSALIKRGLLKSDTPQGKVRFAWPQHALRFYLPALWPDAEQGAQ